MVVLQGADVRRSHRDESGAVLILSAISLVVLLGISALVVDLGVTYSHRRTMQNAADSAALGGAQELANGTTATASAQAMQLGGENFRNVTLNWNGCTDTLPPGFTAYPGSNCISYDTSFERIRVRIPRQTFPSLFAGIFRIPSLSTSTVAIARIVPAQNTALLPFMVFSGFGNGESCLDDGPGGLKVPPCNGPTAGNFNSLDFHQYGNATLGTAPSCGNGGQNARLSANLAMGADHLYSDDPTNTIAAVNDDCVHAEPNQVSQGTGNSQAFDAGMLSGSGFSDGGPARLQRVPSGFSGWESTNVSGNKVDNRPLWEFIPNQTLTGVPTSCQRATFESLLTATPSGQQQVTMHWAIDRCLFEYACGKVDRTSPTAVPPGLGPADPRYVPGTFDCAGTRAGTPLPECGGAPCTAPVFIANSQTEPNLDLYDIQLSPRFAYVPQVTAADIVCSGNSGGYCYHIKVFRAVFMQRLLANNASQLDFEPGKWNPANQSNQKAEAMTGWVLPPSMLPTCLGAGPPTAACPNPSPIQVGKNATIQLIG